MAGSKTAYLSKKLLDHALGGAAFTRPATLYLCLSTATFSPTATGAAMSEIDAVDYARLPVTSDATKWTPASAAYPSEKHNVNDFAWPATTADWGVPKSAYLADAATGGNLLFGADIYNEPTIATGDTPKIPATAFIFEEY
jgi:hypothetical protein